MVTPIIPEVYERADSQLDLEGLSEEEIERKVKDFIYHGDMAPHRIKWGRDKRGRQKYKTVQGTGTTSEGSDYVKRLSEPFKIRESINQAESISFLKEKKYGNRAEKLSNNLGFLTSKLKQQEKKKFDELLNILTNELSPTPKGKENLKRFIESNDYELTKLKWHQFIWKGRTSIGFWNISDGRYITWFVSSKKPTEIEKKEPSEDIKPDEIKEE